MSRGLAALSAQTDRWLARARADAQLSLFRRGARLRLGCSDDFSTVAVAVTEESITVTDDVEVTIVAPSDAWQALLSSRPPAPLHHILAMRMRTPGTRFDGDERTLMRHLHVVRRLVELARETVDAPIAVAEDPRLDRSAIRSRYVSVPIDGQVVDLCIEEAGHGTGAPLLVLHTAGADARQAHPLLTDASLTGARRVVAFDLPGHGRSAAMPDLLSGWSLTPERYAAAILGVISALELDRPVLLGASMAGQACLLMAMIAPERLGGVIACEAADHVPGRTTPWAGLPDVNEALFVPEWIAGLVAPSAPTSMRELIWRTYSQGGHRTFAGDIDFYSGGWDARGRLGEIDTSRCPVVLMTGEYDYSCTPAMSAATASQIPGAHAWTMPGMGHFPICEHPDLFRPHLRRALDLIGDHHA